MSVCAACESTPEDLHYYDRHTCGKPARVRVKPRPVYTEDEKAVDRVLALVNNLDKKATKFEDRAVVARFRRYLLMLRATLR